ncbi:hypothetical protein SAMN05518849_11679 [Sphingobium sp. AP50]|uniref:major capsid protein n=1 Tax=Sphingobium sp. AP50 TaxID=1884369 RepID=UPI0008C3D684|nr:major capsid protein [Sphingobium sp. AP50]SEJ87439.1 hypothetical protein SAMN05518849_11679 [Sphingobium sp. AP50]
MAFTTFEQIYDPVDFAAAVQNYTLEKSAFVQSGILERSGEYTARLLSGGEFGELPFIDDLTGEESVASGVASELISPDPVTMGKMVYQKDFRTKSWGVPDLVARIAGEDLIGAAVKLVGDYRLRQQQKTLIAKFAGFAASNVANNAGDMVKDISIDTTASLTDAHKISFNAILDATLTMGDRFDEITAMVMNSVQWGQLMRIDAANVVRKSDIEPFNRYYGRIVIIDDSIGYHQGTNKQIHTCYLLGTGSVAFATGNERSVIVRDEKAGMGYGATELVTSYDQLMHIKGSTSKAALIGSGKSPTNDTYKLAASHERVFDRKAVKLAFLKTNG